MLVPAVLYKDEIKRKSEEMFYTKDMMYYTGCLESYPIEPNNNQEGQYNWAIVDKNKKLIGYIFYHIDWYSSNAYNFGLISFDKGNPLIGFGVGEIIKKLKRYNIRRVEFRCVGGNPVKRHYDAFCRKFHGRCITLKEVFRDTEGNLTDDYIYEIFI